MARRSALKVLGAVLLLAGLAATGEARKVHYLSCKDCHKLGARIDSVASVCLDCHGGQTDYTLADGTPVSIRAKFVELDSSNAMGSTAAAGYNAAVLTQTSHFWGGASDNQPAAGAQPPGSSFYYSRYGISKGRVTCSRCHNPHGLDDNPTLVRTPAENDAICFECHVSWNQSANQGLETHPLVASYYNAVVADPGGLYNSVQNVASGDVRLVNGGVSCTSCHGVHFVDSDCSTTDGRLNYNSLQIGDGHLLRTDGPAASGATQYNTAQERSLLCQACHTYEMHGKSGNVAYGSGADEAVGCLVCHSGHSYDSGGAPNYFVLRKIATTGAFGTVGNLIYNSPSMNWGMGTGINGYCEKCHGPSENLTKASGALRDHVASEDCRNCHAHNAGTYSFAMGDNATICGDCHGAPPRSGSAATRSDGIVDTGYAVGPDADYLSDPNYKNELNTPHKTHAGALNADKAATDYAFGDANLVSACLPCHNDQPDTVTQTHDTGVSVGSFQDIYFNDFSTYNGLLTPSAYDPAVGTCGSIYCHSNGGKRNEAGKIAADFVTAVAPAWNNGSLPGSRRIIGTLNECEQCHGDDETSMNSNRGAGQKDNSPAHIAHISSTGYAFACHACHAATVDASGAVPAAARDVQGGGAHVNGQADVAYPSSGSALYNALAVNYNGAIYNTAAGTCSVYCHDVYDDGRLADWDQLGTMACDSCHGGLATDAIPIGTGVHGRHVTDPVGPQLDCVQCHGTGADTGSHSGHVDGLYTLAAGGDCIVCHAVDTAEEETEPTWYNAASVDCKTCHTGAGTSSFTKGASTYTAPAKRAAIEYGHGKTGVGQDCTACHDRNAASHFNGLGTALADHRLKPTPNTSQVYNSAMPEAYCSDCHLTAPAEHSHYANSRTTGGVTNTSFDGDQCNDCHDPHGAFDKTSAGLDAMIVGSIQGKDVVSFYNSASRASYFVASPSDANGYGVCQVCHDPNDGEGGINYFSRTAANAAHNNEPAGKLCTDCHKHDDNPAFQASACNSCHGGNTPGQITVTGSNWPDSDPSSQRDDANDIIDRDGAHTTHITWLGTGNNSCTVCHPGNPPGSHLDESAPADVNRIDLNGDGIVDAYNTVYFKTPLGGNDPDAYYNYNSGVNPTCVNVDCHDNTTTPTWYSGNADCDTCHNNGTPQGILASSAPATGKHGKHVAASAAYVDDCNSCHGADANTGQHNGHINLATNYNAALLPSYNSAAATCTNACHAAAAGAWDPSASVRLACIDCHSGTAYIAGDKSAGGGQNRLAQTGLHDEVPTISGTQHGESFLYNSGNLTADCETCHTATPSTSHVDGAFDARPAAGPFRNINFAAGVNYNATNLTCAAAITGCHLDNGAWARKWHENSDQTTGEECNGCHGTYASFGAGWNTGVVHAEFPTRGNSINHNDTGNLIYPCTNCHAIGSVNGSYTFTLGANDWSGGSDHGDKKITMNSNGTSWTRTVVNSVAISGCSNACHSNGLSLATKALRQSGWQTNAISGDGISAGCTSCHGDETPGQTGGVGQTWPDSITSAVNPDQAGAHQVHVDAIGDAVAVYYNAASATLDHKKQSCAYCHPGGAHSGDQSAGPADLYKDGQANADSPSGYNDGANGRFKSLFDNPDPAVTGSDPDGSYDPAARTCSNVDCHANAPYTPGWYGDSVAPAEVTSLTALTEHLDSSSEPNPPGTVVLTWNATGDDGSLDGTAYNYEVRYSTSAITDGTSYNAATIAGNPPTVGRYGKAQRMVVDGLTPGRPYNFAVRTFDEAVNRSPISASVYNSAHLDNVPPDFYGLDFAKASDESAAAKGAVDLFWAAARDHSLPIKYRAWWTTYDFHKHFGNGGTLAAAATCYNSAVPPLQVTCGGQQDYKIDTGMTGGINYHVTGLDANVLYNFIVRAEDSAKTWPDNTPMVNMEQNEFQIMALPKLTPSLPVSMPRYYASGTNLLQKENPTQTAGTTTLSAGSFTWYAQGDALADTTDVAGVTFEIYASHTSKVAETFEILLGYGTGTTWENPVGGAGTPAYVMTLGKRAARVFKVPLSNFQGQVPAGKNLMVRVQNPTTSITFNWGDANKGILTVTEQTVNVQPTTPTVGVPTNPDSNGIFRVTWAQSVDGNGHPIHYDVYASVDGGAAYPYIIDTGVCFDGATYDPDCVPASGDETTDGLHWDTIAAGIGVPDMNGNPNPATGVMVRVAAGDGYSHTVDVTDAPFTVDNTADNLAPAGIGDVYAADGTTLLYQGLRAETRPKQGSIYLTWTAVGNDGYNHGSRAAVYDIRYSTSPITDVNWGNTGVVTQAEGEPVPGFSGEMEGFELLGLQPDVSYYIGIKVGDATGNWSPLSVLEDAVGTQIAAVAGPKCGICHSTPPDESATFGTHEAHGYTIADCAKCHGDQALGFKANHQDGKLYLGYGKNPDGTRMAPVLAIVNGTEVKYNQAGVTIYRDSDGAGGFNFTTGMDGVDDGTCAGFVGANATGCHGSYSPTWGEQVTRKAQCADCHGKSSRTTDIYGYMYEDRTGDIATSDYVPSDSVKASPPVDNRGNDPYLADGVTPDPAATDAERKHVGAHLKHLNSSFRYAKGDSCRLCHDNNNHADGTADVRFYVTAGEAAHYNAATVPAGSCYGTSGEACHGAPTTAPQWDSGLDVTCDSCHGMEAVKAANGGLVPHTKGKDGAQVDCTYCHLPGHPQNGDLGLIQVPNNPVVGIAYKSGGIHLKKSPGPHGAAADYGPFATEAELCWGCHDAQVPTISEWGKNTDIDSTQVPKADAPYDYGQVNGGTSSKWIDSPGVGAVWTSAKFAYKEGPIQSTHTVNGAGSSALSGTPYNYNETVDDVSLIRCSWCHDVHDLNKAEKDTANGAPFLRGTWKGNPYEEDGAPRSDRTYTAVNTYGTVPRAGTGYNQLGGYFIDQNNVVPGTTTSNAFPTDGWTLQSSAGLCTYCHGTDVNNMDQRTGENLWITTSAGMGNGHSNAAIGGTFTMRRNIFDYRHGRPVPRNPLDDAKDTAGEVPSMGWQSIYDCPVDEGYAYGYRGSISSPYYEPNAGSRKVSWSLYNWGATVDNDTTDIAYHQFSCSKCHNPHASRLPKLMITNCLDIQHNKWDDALAAQTSWTYHQSSGRYDYGKTTAYYSSAQNCHRYDDQFTPGTNGNGETEYTGGWNKVTPWPKSQEPPAAP